MAQEMQMIDEYKIHFTTEPEKIPKEKFIEAMKGWKKDRYLLLSLDICTKCGVCADQCHIYKSDPKEIYNPAWRAGLIRNIYKKELTLRGRIFGKLLGTDTMGKTTLRALAENLYRCNVCRRCAHFCPFGVDNPGIVGVGRNLFTSLGVVPKYIQSVTDNVNKTRNNMGIPKPAFLDTISFVEDEIKSEIGQDVKVPIDKEGAEIYFIPPSADFFANIDTLIGYIKMFHAAGANWTMSSDYFEIANFGLFYDDNTMMKINKSVIEEAKKLKCKFLVAGECGHAWRVIKLFSDKFWGPLPFEVKHVFEIALDYINKGKIKLNPEVNKDPVTLHDPCNLVRIGGIIEQQREILKAAVKDFREMSPNREENYCCGGGGGLLMEELIDFRMKTTIKQKVEQVKATGATYLAAPCAICKAQFNHAKEHGVWDVQVGGVIDLLGKAIV